MGSATRLRPRRLARAAAAAGLALVTAAPAVALAGCTSDANTVASQALAGDDKGYVAGDGTVQQLATGKRTTTVALSGSTLDGTPWSTATDARGRVVVVNVWGSWCPPCVEETPQLQKVWSTVSSAGQPVAFIGIAIKESSATSAAFVKANGVTYPSLSDSESGGQPMLALQGKAPATPTTLVLDRQGRIAARVLGPVTAATLSALVGDVLAEDG